jgi:hypothetical protein
MKVDYTPFGGGLDLVTGTIGVKPGRVASSLNFEQVFGRMGYRRIDGYERFDGRPQPHLARYFAQEFDQGSIEIFAADAITGTTAAATVLAVVLDSGTWGDGTAAGSLYVVLTAGEWVATQNILKGGLPAAVAVSNTFEGRAQTSADHESYLSQAREQRRALIQKVPGEGAVLGVGIHNDEVYAARNAAGGLTASLWRSSGAGWVLVSEGLLPGGRFEFVSTNFSGDATQNILLGCDGRNIPFRLIGTVYTEMAPIFGSQATSATSLAVTVGSKVFTLVQTARSYSVGDVLLIHSSASAANRMTGTVTAYAHPNLTVSVTTVVGAGAFADWRLGLASFQDKPYLLTAHKDHLFLAYPRGQLQASNLGDPMVYTTTAALFGMGEELTGLASLKGAVLGVFCDNRISLLNGSSSLDWSLGIHAQNIGTKLHTVQENAGNALFLGERGMVSMQATDAFGSFEPAICSRDVKPLLDAKLPLVVGSRLVRGKYQYRMYFSDGTAISAGITTPSASLQPEDVSFLALAYLHTVSCLVGGSIADEDWLLFGTSDGYVMREDIGASFDGAAIDSSIRLHFNNFKSPAAKKRYYKLTLEMESADDVQILFRQLHDLSDGFYFDSLTQSATSPGSGGEWDIDTWDSFFWSTPLAVQVEANVDGVSKSMSVVLFHESAIDQPFTLQGLLTQYKLLGLSR